MTVPSPPILDTNVTARHIVAAVGVVLLSVGLPLACISWCIQSAFSDKVLGLPSNEWNFFQGEIIGDELWFGATSVSGQLFALNQGVCKIKRLDLTTGQMRDTTLAIPGDYCIPILMLGELYAVTGFQTPAISRRAGDKLEKIADLPPRSPTFARMPFEYNGQVTIVVETERGFQLQHLAGQQWVAGRHIHLPLPRQQPAVVAVNFQLTVIQQHPHVHVFLRDHYSEFAVYRDGFDFIDDIPQEVSAQLPENLAPELRGWKPVEVTPRSDNHMARDRNGPLFHSANKLTRLNEAGEFETVARLPNYRYQRNLVTGADVEGVYVIDEDTRWGSATVHRIKGNELQSTILKVPGGEREYMARWKQALSGLFVGWLLHLGTLLTGTAWLSRRFAPDSYQFGIQRAVLASIWQRALAFAIDLLLVATTVILGWNFLVAMFTNVPFVENELCHRLYDIELAAARDLNTVGLNWRSPSIGSLFNLFGKLAEDFTVGFAMAALLFLLLVYVEARFGLTPGKRLLGIRTVRSTLRPISDRALVRSLMSWVDVPFLLTPLPAAISLMFSRQRQRLADRVADTIVIRSPSSRQDAHKTLPQI